MSVRLGDSRQVMRELFRELAPVAHPGGLFAYLDAHWYQDLPLGEELDIAFSWDPAAIVMIDDFQVPDDTGYGYDGYAGLKAEYIEPVLRAHRLVALYPTLPSSREGGSKRGCVVLASEERWKSTLLSTGLLRQIAQGSPISSS